MTIKFEVLRELPLPSTNILTRKTRIQQNLQFE